MRRGSQKMDWSLTQNVLGNKEVSKDGLEGMLREVWKVPHRFEVEQIGSNNMFVFLFGSVKDRQ